MAAKKAEMLLIQSKVREHIRGKKLRTSEEFIDAFNDRLFQVLNQAIDRAAKNGRQTLRAQDA